MEKAEELSVLKWEYYVFLTLKFQSLYLIFVLTLKYWSRAVILSSCKSTFMPVVFSMLDPCCMQCLSRKLFLFILDSSLMMMLPFLQPQTKSESSDPKPNCRKLTSRDSIWYFHARSVISSAWVGNYFCLHWTVLSWWCYHLHTHKQNGLMVREQWSKPKYRKLILAGIASGILHARPLSYAVIE